MYDVVREEVRLPSHTVRTWYPVPGTVPEAFGKRYRARRTMDTVAVTAMNAIIVSHNATSANLRPILRV